MEAVVPFDLYVIRTLLDALERSDDDVTRYVKPLRVEGHRLVCDLKWFVNLTFFPDVYVPLKPERTADAERLAAQIWAMVATGAPRPPHLAWDLTQCIDMTQETSQRAMKKLEEFGLARLAR